MAKRILITGCPRSGTHYTAVLLTRCGVDVVHEWRWRTVLIDWHRAVDAPRNARVLHQVRAPLAAIGSMTTIRPPSWLWLAEGIRNWHNVKLRQPLREHLVLNAATCWLYWNCIAAAHAEWTFRVEALPEELGELLDQVGAQIPLSRASARAAAIPTRFHSREHREVTWPMLERLDRDLAAGIRQAARHYGYEEEKM